MKNRDLLFALLLLALVPGTALAVQDASPVSGTSLTTAALVQEEQDYARASSALDAGRYQEAIDLFRQIARDGTNRRDAAMYWIAYAQFRQGQRAAALRSIAELRAGYPASGWLDDARYLEVEIRGASGQEVDPARVEDEEMRMHALNSLMHVDPERAMPILERIISGDGSPEMKEKALFILLHAEPDGATEVLARIARQGETPRMRRMAAQFLGQVGDEQALQVLDEIYAQTEDREMKEAVLHGFMMAEDRARLLRIAREESVEELRIAAIHSLAMSEAREELWTLYSGESSREAREAILHSLAMAGETGRLLDLARTETDPELRRAAVEALAIYGEEADEEIAGEVRALMLDVYRDATDEDLRDAALQWFWMREDAGALIELFENEQDRDARRQIVEALSMMESQEAIDFLIRLIEQ